MPRLLVPPLLPLLLLLAGGVSTRASHSEAHSDLPTFPLPEALKNSLPAPRYKYALEFAFTGFGTAGCAALFGNKTRLTYTPGTAAAAAKDDERSVEIAKGDFSLNGSSCGAGGASYVTKSTLPLTSAIGHKGLAVLIDFASPEVEVEFASVLSKVGEVMQASRMEVACRKGEGLVGDVALGEQGHFVFGKEYRRAPSDPRKGEVVLKEGYRYAYVAIGLVGVGEDLCLLDAGIDPWWKQGRDEAKGNNKGDSGRSGGKKNSMSEGKIGGIVAATIVALALFAGLLAWYHLRK